MARPGLLRNRKFVRLSGALNSLSLGEDRHVRGFGHALAWGSLEMLWSVVYENGDDVVGTPEDVEALAGWNGPPGILFAALRDCGLPDRPGFVEESPDRPGVWRIHDLWDHAPEYVATRREREQERKKPKKCDGCGTEYRSTDARSRYCTARCRTAAWRNKNAPVTDGNVDVRHDRRTVTDCDGPPAPAPAPAPAPPKEACSEASSEPSSPQPASTAGEAERPPGAPARAAASPPHDDSPIVAVLPCVGSGPKSFHVTASMCAAWTKAYPAVDVMLEIGKAVQWAVDNPTRRKTAKGARSFLGRWLAKQQDHGGAQRNGHTTRVIAPPSDFSKQENKTW